LNWITKLSLFSLFLLLNLANVNACYGKIADSLTTTSTVEEQDWKDKYNKHADNLLIIAQEPELPIDIVKALEEMANRIKELVLEAESDTLWELKAENTYASWYGYPNMKLDRFHGRKTANGDRYDTYKFTCAVKMKLRSSKFYKFGDILKITNLNNGLSVVCRVNDVGSLTPRRTIDLSWACMKALDGLGNGEIPIKVERMIK